MILEICFGLFIIWSLSYINFYYNKWDMIYFRDIMYYTKVLITNYITLKILTNNFNNIFTTHVNILPLLVNITLNVSYIIFDYIFFYKIDMQLSRNIHHILTITWFVYSYYFIGNIGYLLLMGLIDVSSLFLGIMHLYKPKSSNLINILFAISFFVFRVCVPIYLLYYTMTNPILRLNDKIIKTNIFLGIFTILNSYWFYEIFTVARLQIKMALKKNKKNKQS